MGETSKGRERDAEVICVAGLWEAGDAGGAGGHDTGQEGRGQTVRPLGVLPRQLPPSEDLWTGSASLSSLLRSQDAAEGT